MISVGGKALAPFMVFDRVNSSVLPKRFAFGRFPYKKLP